MNILYLILLIIATVNAFYWAIKYINWGTHYSVYSHVSSIKDFGLMLIWLLLLTISGGCIVVVLIFVKSTFLGG